jgi:hypothetical protein
MPCIGACNESQKAMNDRDEEPPCTLPRPSGNGGAESNGAMDSDEDSDEELQVAKKKRTLNGRREFTLIKRWVTSKKTEMDSEDIERELFELDVSVQA